MAAMAETCSC